MKYFLSLVVFFFSSVILAQQTDVVDFKTANFLLGFDVDSSKVGGMGWYTFKILKPSDSIYIDAINMTFGEVKVVDDEAVEIDLIYGNDGKKLWLKSDFKKGGDYKLFFNYSAKPKKALYFVERDNDTQIWTQGQGKYTSNWLPSLDDMNDKIEFDISVTFSNDYYVLANGEQTLSIPLPGYTKWHYQMDKPMSSYLVALAIGKYDKKVEYSKSGIPLEMYYYPEDSAKFEPTYRYTKRMFDFLEEEIAVPYPWQNYKQVPVHDFLYAGMENTSLTIFADTFVTDSIGFIDRNYVNVNAHELAHQWFGNLVTETSGTHHWLHESFATYYALLAEKEIFGEDYYYWKLYEYAQQLLDQDKAGGSTSLLDPKSSSLTFYQKGAWVLHMLRERAGDKAFKVAVKSYLEKHQFKNVETDDFISEVQKMSGEDLTEFTELWLTDKKLPYESMEVHLYQNSTLMKGYLQLDCMNKDKCKDIFDDAVDYRLRQKAVEMLGLKTPKQAFITNDIELRQVIAKTMSKIPVELKEDYESLLKDKSYATIEAALYHLWSNFPEDRSKYLEHTKDIIGFSDKNVRMLWLVLNLVTPDYQPDSKKKVFDELLAYSSNTYGFEVRLQAFNYLNGINACNDVCKQNLEDAAKHHNWRLQKFAKNMLNKNQ